MAKEKLKANIVEVPTIFVGLGGTGCKVVKAVAEMCHPKEKEKINFVCLDTNVNDLMGIRDSKSNIYYVQTSSTQTVGDYLNYDLDALQHWFPKSAVIYDKTVSEGAGQVRAISRLALNATIKTGRLSRLYDAIDDLFRKDGQELKQAIRVVMVSTSSGGTGSGMILPLSMVIRDYISNKYPSASLLTRAMILLPETLDSVIKSNVERESQRRNAYAMIKEINAFMMKGSGFLDADGDLKRYSDIHVDVTEPGTDELKSLALLPFDFCFLMDGQNAEDSTLKTLNQYIEQAALALYEQNVGPMMKKAFGMEDNIIKEMSNPGNYGRNRFGGIGAGAIRYPYEDVADYIAYDWAKDTVEGEGAAAGWTRYDKTFKIKEEEERRHGIPQSDRTRIEDYYISQIDNNDEDSFTKDLRSFYLSEASEQIDEYFMALDAEMEECMTETRAIGAQIDIVRKLGKQIDYSDKKNQGKARSNLELLRAFQISVIGNIDRPSASKAEAIFQNESKTANAQNQGKKYTIEHLISRSEYGVAHPNAMRYFLYALKIKFKERRDEMMDEIRGYMKTMDDYSQNAARPELFDIGYSKAKEMTIDDLCAVEKKPDVFDKLGGYDQLYEKLNVHFPKWFKAINGYGLATAKFAAYDFGYRYVDELIEEFKRFYEKFPAKVATLSLKQDDLVEALAFREGDSIFNVCSTGDMLKELSRGSNQSRGTGAMLPSDLCAQIFDAVKANVAFRRETRNLDVVENDRSVDIFDDILFEYFRTAVRENCTDIDMNIIEAIAKEWRLLDRIEIRRNAKEGEQIVDRVTADDCRKHIVDIIEMGRRLSAPSIQRPRNEEPREIGLIAYNSSLKEMRTYRMNEIIDGDSTAVDTVSRYELHYFNALYNLTPNKLDKFAARVQTETRKKGAGLYHNAYRKYARNIGPDSTKNTSISTHIDKRWDSIAVMPELDLIYQNRQMMRIHQAMIYGLVHGAIHRAKMSTVSGGKEIYKYEDSDERGVELIVSNGTLCDEFYEILDALYINSAIVEDVDAICEDKRKGDRFRNANYESTTFATDVAAFSIQALDETKTSLFEIPLAYYSSLPNSKRFDAEIATLVEAVVKTFRDEITRWEKKDDIPFLLRRQLIEQFELMVDNYTEDRFHMTISDNPVIDIIYRKIKNVLEEVPEADDCAEQLKKMREKIR